MTTPWGPSQDVVTIVPGLAHWFNTASHGGMKINLDAYPLPPDVLARPFIRTFKTIDGSGARSWAWLEEDCEWAWAIVQHPELADGLAAAWHGDDPERIRRAAADTVETLRARAIRDARSVAP